jgi:hypothetical protein
LNKCHNRSLWWAIIARTVIRSEAFGYLKRSDEGIWSIGAAPLRLASIYESNLHPAEIILPVLRELVAATRESASLYVKAGDQGLCASRVDSPRSVRMHGGNRSRVNATKDRCRRKFRTHTKGQLDFYWQSFTAHFCSRTLQRWTFLRRS